MGLQNNQSSGAFLTIGNGKICRQVPAPTPTSIERTNKANKQVHEEFFDTVSGLITAIAVTEHPEYGKFWNITLEDGADRFHLKMNYSGGYSSSFLKTLPNVDLGKPVTLIPNMKEVDGKKRTNLFISQDGHALKFYYNRENPNGLPELAQVKIKGKLTWDDSDQMEFLENMVNTAIVPHLKGASVAAPAPAMAGHDDEPAVEGDDKMPF